MITFTLEANHESNQPENTWRRIWIKYNKDLLCQELSCIDWNITATDVQSFCNILENKLVYIVDKLAPLKLITPNNNNSNEMSSTMRRLISLKRRKLRKWKQSKRSEDYDGVKDLNKLANRGWGTCPSRPHQDIFLSSR